MAEKPILYGFDGSTYVRTARTVMALKGVAYEQVPVNVLEGEPRKPEHLARHPFGKVPVLDIDGLRIRETDAICRYLAETRSGPSVIPDTARDRARMNEGISLTTSYGYAAMLGVAGYHLFPDFLGGRDDAAKAGQIADSRTYLGMMMELKGGDAYIAGSEPSLADFFLGPLVSYVALTEDSNSVLSVPGVSEWWQRLKAVAPFAETAPDMG